MTRHNTKSEENAQLNDVVNCQVKVKTIKLYVLKSFNMHK